MVAKSPVPIGRKRVTAAAAVDPVLIRSTLDKVDSCMARLQEMQLVVLGGSKVVAGVHLSPRSSRGYLRTSLRCKQETLSMRGSLPKKSPNSKFAGLATTSSEWRQMSLSTMLLDETVLEILQASKFAKDVASASPKALPRRTILRTPPKTSGTTQPQHPEKTPPLRARRDKEKESRRQGATFGIPTPSSRARARCRIQFRSVSPLIGPCVSANRVSPKHRPWAKKTVLFPNPAFHLPEPSGKSGITRTPPQRQTPCKFLIKSPPSALGTQLKYRTQIVLPTASPPIKTPLPKARPPESNHRRRSFSPSRLAARLVSPIKARLVSPIKTRLSLSKAGVAGLKQRPAVFRAAPPMVGGSTSARHFS